MFKYTLLLKVVTLIVLTMLMLIPVVLVKGVIDERFSYKNDVIRTISYNAGGEQRVIGPILVLPFKEKIKVVQDGKESEQESWRERYVLPENLSITGNASVETRQLGIYQAQVYQSDLAFTGKIKVPDLSFLKAKNITAEKPYLIVMVSDSRGINRIPVLNINQTTVEFQGGTQNSFKSNGINAELSHELLENSPELDFNFTLALKGSQQLSVVPLGRSSEFKLIGNWPHPSFVGDYPPVAREITDSGFSATWQSSWLANNINDRFSNMAVGDEYVSLLPMFTTKLIEPVAEYQLNDRAVKYAILFITLTFLAFFLFETLKGLRVHPLQYLLVGFALVVFYLLLLALSERIGFNYAYLVASIACSGLITFYLMSALKGVQRGLIFGMGLLMLYAVLFGLLQSEGDSLLLGSIMLFIVLSIVMALTRKLDWYQLSHKLEKREAEENATGPEVIFSTGGGPAEEEVIAEEKLDRDVFRVWK